MFSLTPPASPGGAWVENVLFSFFYSSGELPYGGLAIDKAGPGHVPYGTTSGYYYSNLNGG